MKTNLSNSSAKSLKQSGTVCVLNIVYLFIEEKNLSNFQEILI
jgi:hypothetical protein